MEGASASSRTCSRTPRSSPRPPTASSGPAASSRWSTRATTSRPPSATSSGTSRRSATTTSTLVSPESPLGQALIGARDGEWVTYEAPNGRAAREGAQSRDGLATFDRRSLRDRSVRYRSPGHWTCRRGGWSLRELLRTAGRPDGRPAPRARRHGRHQLLPLLPSPRRAVSRAGVRPSRSRGRASGRADRSGSAIVPTTSSAMADIVGVDRFVPVGYSMGGAVAQLVWQRHRRRVGGLVLCATASHFNGTRVEQINFLGLGGLAAMARLTPPAVRRTIAARYRRDRHADWATVGTRADGALGLAGGARSGRRPRPVPLRSVDHRDRRPGVGGR